VRERREFECWWNEDRHEYDEKMIRNMLNLSRIEVVQVGQGEKTMNQAGPILIYLEQVEPSLKMMSLHWPSLNQVKN
jgi:hypothetical protein